MLRNVFLFFLLCSSITLSAQYSIRGKIIDEANEPLVGANVIIEKSNLGVVTDKLGEYTLKGLPEGNYAVKVSFLGFETIEKDVNLTNNVKIDFTLSVSPVMADEVIVQGTKAGNKSPVAFTNVTEKEIEQRSLGQDLPYLLNLTPSMVVTSDAGAGVGYTGFRIRGSDANRVNITVNGIPMNDAESHGVWWVNMPDFASSIDNIQVQRGVGTSTNGAGAFGATINMQTNALEKDAYAEISSSAGSFKTFKNTAQAGTGLLGDHFAFNLRLSKINSDGYIDRATSDLKSFFFSGGYYAKNTIIKANIFSGKEKTYQSWWGVPKVRLENDLEGMMRYEEHWLYTPEQTEHMINSDSRTYNYYTYNNETDNYQQDHYQFFFSRKLGEYLYLNTAIHYTYGRGYYEQYRADDDLTDYNLPALNIITEGDTITTTDLVRQKWLDNDFYGTTFSLNYTYGGLNAIIGGAWNQYVGRHFGKIIWAQYLSEDIKDYEWYRNTGVKTDYNVYGKINYDITDYLNLFGDLQLRHISHDIKGLDDDYRDITQEHDFDFFNPKFGIILKPGVNQQAYASFAVAHREPNRSNFTDADPDGPVPKPEMLRDIEVGYNYKSLILSVGANIYYMDYKDQLILTGEINDVGSAIMVNVDNSFRRGLEIYGGVKITDNLNWEANATFSQNKIINFTEYVDDWDNGGQQVNNPGETDIAFSPGFIASSNLVFEPVKNLNVALISKYVSDQYIDNTSSQERKLDAYFVNNIRVTYQFSLKGVKRIELNLLVNNIFSEEYETNAWVYSYLLGGERYAMDGYFPQAGINFLVGANIRF